MYLEYLQNLNWLLIGEFATLFMFVLVIIVAAVFAVNYIYEIINTPFGSDRITERVGIYCTIVAAMFSVAFFGRQAFILTQSILLQLAI